MWKYINQNYERDPLDCEIQKKHSRCGLKKGIRKSKNCTRVLAPEVMATPGAGLGAFPPLPSVQFLHHQQQQDYNHSNPYHYPHTYPPFVPPPSAGPPYVMAPVAPSPAAPPPPQNNYNNNKQIHNRHHDDNNNHKERVRTLFISGLPEDIKQREIYNLFRRRPGFEACQLKYTGRGYQVLLSFILWIFILCSLLPMKIYTTGHANGKPYRGTVSFFKPFFGIIFKLYVEYHSLGDLSTLGSKVLETCHK